MKLWKKLMLTLLPVLFLALGICGAVTVGQTRKSSLDVTVENYRKQLEAVSYTFSQFGSRLEFEDMSGNVQNAYLKFQFQKCCGEGYALLNDGEVLLNLTNYDVVNPDGMAGNYLIQTLNGRKILVLKETLESLDGYEIFAIHDITDTYVRIRQQVKLLAAVYLGVAAIVTLLIFILMKWTLGPLKELKQTAAHLSQGKLEERVSVKTRDEIGEVGMAFNHMAEQIEHQVEDLKLLLGALTHELKTPMTSIIGYSDSLLHVKLPKEQQDKALRYIYQEGKRMELLSSKMMDLLGMYENETIHMETVSAERLFAGIRQMKSLYLEEKNMELVTEGNPEQSFSVDKELIKCLLGNLIQNAARASAPGSRIILRSVSDGFEVEDFGIGIPQEEISRITKAFYMVDKSRSRKEGGAGLGLALCAQIAELHGARLIIRSRMGEGTVVKVAFSDDNKTFTG